MRLSIGDRRVIWLFLLKKEGESNKLWTDGAQLDGLWFGGSGIALWEEDEVKIRDLGSKTADQVGRTVVKEAEYLGISIS